MRKLILCTALALGATGLTAGTALAGPGQCYDRRGNPVGGIYDTDNPNYNFIQSVQRNGGTCGSARNAPPGPNYRYGNPNRYDDGYRDNYGDRDRDRNRYRGRWTDGNDERALERERRRVEQENIRRYQGTPGR